MASPSTSTSASHSVESSESAISQAESSKSMLVLIPDKIDIEEEARFYDDIVDVSRRCSSCPDRSQADGTSRARAPSVRTNTHTDNQILPRSHRTRRSLSSRGISGSGITRVRATRSRGTWRSQAGQAWGISRKEPMSVSSPFGEKPEYDQNTLRGSL